MSDKKKEKGTIQVIASEAELEAWRKAMGGQLAVERDMRGFTQEELARELGVSQKTVSKTEQGATPNIDRYLAQALALGVPFHLIIARAALVMEAAASGASSPLPFLQRGQADNT